MTLTKRKTNWRRTKEVGDKLFNVRMPRELANRLDAYVAGRNTTRTQAVRTATREYLERQQA